MPQVTNGSDLPGEWRRDAQNACPTGEGVNVQEPQIVTRWRKEDDVGQIVHLRFAVTTEGGKHKRQHSARCPCTRLRDLHEP